MNDYDESLTMLPCNYSIKYNYVIQKIKNKVQIIIIYNIKSTNNIKKTFILKVTNK